jgi:hypothetical protein
MKKATPRLRKIAAAIKAHSKLRIEQDGQEFQVEAGRIATLASSPNGVPYAYHQYFPCDAARANASAGPIDASGNGHNMSLGGALLPATCWANAGYATTAAAANGHFASTFQMNYQTDMMVMSFVMNMAAPGGLVFFAGSCDYLPAETGLILGTSNDGKLRVYMCTGTSTITPAFIGGANPVVADGTDHKIGIAYDYPRRAFYVWVDGTLVLSATNSILSTAAAWTRPWIFGCNKAGTAAQVVKFKQINLYGRTSGRLPANINNVMSTYATTPQDIGKLFDQRTKGMAFFMAGQSNQTGQGVTAGLNTGLGTPIQDPTYPNGQVGKRSFFPSMAAVLGAASYKMDVYNYAIGGTSVVDSWVGRVRNWAAGMWVKSGTFVASGGRFYKAAMASQINITNQVSINPSANLVDAAAGVTWTDVGPDTGFRGVATDKSSPFWDPNGNIAAMLTGVASCDSTRKFAYLAWGETDANMAVSSADFASALIALTAALLAAGVHKVGIGFTLGTPAYAAYYDSTLIPGVDTAVAAFVKTGQVYKALNMYKAFGVLPVNPASGIGTQADALHGNDAIYDLAGTALGNDALAQLQNMA